MTFCSFQLLFNAIYFINFYLVYLSAILSTLFLVFREVVLDVVSHKLGTKNNAAMYHLQEIFATRDILEQLIMILASRAHTVCVIDTVGGIV